MKKASKILIEIIEEAEKHLAEGNYKNSTVILQDLQLISVRRILERLDEIDEKLDR